MQVPKTRCSPKPLPAWLNALLQKFSNVLSLLLCLGVKCPVGHRSTCVSTGDAHSPRVSSSVYVARVPEAGLWCPGQTQVQQDSNQAQDCVPPTPGEQGCRQPRKSALASPTRPAFDTGRRDGQPCRPLSHPALLPGTSSRSCLRALTTMA